MSLLERLDAGLNPVWIKEVRQGLRSRLFRIGYLTTLILATLVTVTTLSDTDDRGVRVFGVTVGALIFATLGLVPFYSFYTAPGEGQSRALELVLLTGLSPRRIAAGRLLTAMTYNLLFFSAFLPFMSVAAMLPGLDLLAAGVCVAVTLVGGAGVSAAAIGLGAVLRSRILRGLVGLLLSGVLLYTCLGAVIMVSELLRRPQEILEPHFPMVVVFVLALPLTCGIYGFGATAASLAHPEDNHSTPMRVATLCLAILALSVVLYAGGLGTASAADAFGGALVVLGVLGFPLGVFLVEPDRLGRRVAATLPRRGLALLLAPLLPGGGRAMAFTILLLGGFVGLVNLVVGARVPADRLPVLREGMWTALSYGLIYLLVPALAVKPWANRVFARRLALFAMPALPLFTALVPTIVGEVIGAYELRRGNHPGNPLWMVTRLWRGYADEGDGLVVQLLAMAVVVACLPAIARGFFEVYEATERDHGQA